MNILDIISDSPRTYIFQKGSNKTNFGGIFTLIYLIAILLITTFYLYDFFTYEKYEYNDYTKVFQDEKQREEKKNDIHYNPFIGFSFEIQDDIGNNFNDNFTIVIQDKNNKVIQVQKDKKYYYKVGDFQIIILYNCSTNNCTFNYTEQNGNNKNNINIFQKSLKLLISHDSKNIDFERDEPVKDDIYKYRIDFQVNKLVEYKYEWNTYNFEEQKSIFSRVLDSLTKKPNNWTFGEIGYSSYFDVSDTEYNQPQLDENTNKYYKFVLAFYIENTLRKIVCFKRKQSSILDYFANIGSLSITILNIITKIYCCLYSKNFDNYKIIENILNKENKKVENIPLVNIKEVNTNLEEDLIIKNTENKYKDNNKATNEQDASNKSDDDDLCEEERDKLKSKLPKLRFYDFIFNNLYAKCCVYIKKQKLLDSCDDLLYKYYSIENMIYNQILFENLMKDYKWNNPELKSIQINDSIGNIKKYI
jgi:hypothetical protein